MNLTIQKNIDADAISKQLVGDISKANGDVWPLRIRALSKAITLLENDPLLAPSILAHASVIRQSPSKSWVLGLTGLPGAGKSSITNLLIQELRQQNKTVAVLAVDPSSSKGGGALLGDRIRMQDHFRDPGVFIRSMGSRGALGGIAKATRGAVRLAGLLNFDLIIIETVGIGQNESEIVDVADTTALVLMPNSGDEVQLMKAGILQMADVYVVNKSDLASPDRMLSEIHENTAPADPSLWTPPVLATSANEKKGITELLNAIFDHQAFEQKNPQSQTKKLEKAKKEVLKTLLSLAEPRFLQAIAMLTDDELNALLSGQVPAMALAQKLFAGMKLK